MHSTQDALRTHPSMLQRAGLSTDHPVWDELLEYYDPFFTAVLRNMQFKSPAIEDVKQLAFVQLWKNLPAYRKLSDNIKFRSWLAKLIRNVALNWIRDHQKQQSESTLHDDSPPNEELVHSPEIEAKIEREWQAYVVELAMERLQTVFTGKAFEVLQLSLEGCSGDEISSRLGIRTDSVYVLRNRVKKRVQQEIAQIRHELEGGSQP